MHVISWKKLRTFFDRHPNAEAPLRSWYKVVERARWEKFADVRNTYASADLVDGKFVVFNIGRKYRLIAVIHYNRGKVFVRHVLTHTDYDKGKWKKD